jgi:hypothetical protein
LFIEPSLAEALFSSIVRLFPVSRQAGEKKNLEKAFHREGRQGREGKQKKIKDNEGQALSSRSPIWQLHQRFTLALISLASLASFAVKRFF